MSDPWDSGVVETYSGREFDVLDPDPDAVHLDDVAAALAHVCRFGGHCRQFYSVAHHSIHVSREFPDDEPRLQVLGLLHDAAEAYVGDVPRPLKAEHEAFERIERRVLDAVWPAFGVTPPRPNEWERVMAADDRLLAYEADAILADGSWAGEPPALDYDLDSTPVEAVRERFTTRCETLLDRI